MKDGRNTARGAASESTVRRTHRRLMRARARLAISARRRQEQEWIVFADPFFVDPLCLLSPR
ncbi:MAG TPA: hypothetical protein VM864_12050 [Pyrinomonadaceae bacterium]|jgi:hypothetical protein|nr:hypothetical protein [Pyrinomonadaceae bacterium]